MDKLLKNTFDFVGVIDKTKYPDNKEHVELDNISSIFVVGLAYPSVTLKQKQDRLLGSIYTYGYDYHDVIKDLVDETLEGYEYEVLVDNHNLDERKCLELTGLAYWAKNDLMIHRDFGSYFFIGLVLSKEKYPEIIVENNDSCGDCTICIRACPVNALKGGYQIDKCLSTLNQLKEPFTLEVIKKNYLLLGCDICQKVCPKNKITIENYHEKFSVQETTYVLVDDLFKMSNKEFFNKYGKHAYLWKGKTLLLRNALTILLRQKNTNYNEEIRKTIAEEKYPAWYKKDAKNILEMLESYK